MKVSDQKIQNIPIKNLEIWKDANVRKVSTNSDVEELAENIRQNGIENPLLVKKQDKKFLIFAGQRRFLAAQIAGLSEIPCRVFQKISLKDAIALSLSENIFSRPMTTVDKANAVKELIEKNKDKKQVCKIMGIEMSTLKVYLSYHGLPNEIKTYVDDGVVSMQLALKIFRKFTNANAVEITRYLSILKNNPVRRKLLVSAISNADKTDSLEEIKKNIKHGSVSLNIVLDSNLSSTLQTLAKGEGKSIDEMARAVLEKYLNKASSVLKRK